MIFFITGYNLNWLYIYLVVLFDFCHKKNQTIRTLPVPQKTKNKQQQNLMFYRVIILFVRTTQVDNDLHVASE